jgi:hypothetical protein
LTDSPTIANEEILTLRNARITLDHRIGAALYCTPLAMLATSEIGRARHREVSCCLDFLAPHVYPEACQNTPQIDRDAVIVFSVD